jgi:beta-glucosidase/6-phospho-beta-glucosidase/beta-galactosidase
MHVYVSLSYKAKQISILSTGTADFFGLNHYTTKTATFRQDKPGFSFSSDTGITLSAPSDWPVSETSEWELVS